MDDFENIVDEFFDVVGFFGEGGFKVFEDGEWEVFFGHDLEADGDGGAVEDVDFAGDGFEFAEDHFEDGAFACAILAHDGDFGVFADGEAGFFEEGFVVVVVEVYFVEAQYYIAVVHGFLVYVCGDFTDFWEFIHQFLIL